MKAPLDAQRELEVVISGLPYFRALRPDEIVRIAHLFQLRWLDPGEALTLEADDPVEMVTVVAGPVWLELARHRRRLFRGDRYGDLSTDTRELRPARLLAGRRRALVALCDRAALDRILDEFPATAVPLCEEIAASLKWKNDLIRDLEIIHREGLPDDQRRAALASRERKLGRRRRDVVRAASRALWRHLVLDRDREPAFWVLTGFLLALATARTLVGFILRFNLQGKLFALIPSAGGLNPVHVHHFNYGIALVVISGVFALVPATRRRLRLVAFAFGVGLGLIVDEFALLLHLDPDYYQRASYVAIILATLVLLQLIYFRNLYLGLVRRLAEKIRSWAR
jgi:hypothetical protein